MFFFQGDFFFFKGMAQYHSQVVILPTLKDDALGRSVFLFFF